MTTRKFRVAPDPDRLADEAAKKDKKVQRIIAKMEAAERGLKRATTRLKRAKTAARKYQKKVRYYIAAWNKIAAKDLDERIKEDRRRLSDKSTSATRP